MDNSAVTQMLVLDSRKKLIIDGIKNVEGFSEEFLELESDLGKICVEGEGLKIDELSHESGKVSISGSINGIFYDDNKKKTGIFGRLFK